MLFFLPTVTTRSRLDSTVKEKEGGVGKRDVDRRGVEVCVGACLDFSSGVVCTFCSVALGVFVFVNFVECVLVCALALWSVVFCL